MRNRMAEGRKASTDPMTVLTVQVDNAGKIFDVRLSPGKSVDYRHSCVGRSFREMPLAVSEFCLHETASHQLAAAKAADSLLAIRIPAAAENWRRLFHYGHLVQSHASQIMGCSGRIDSTAKGIDASCQQQLQSFAQSAEFLSESLRLRHSRPLAGRDPRVGIRDD